MNASTSDQEVPQTRQRELRLKVPLTCVALFWAVSLVAPLIDKLYFVGFLTQVASTLLLALFFLGWWFFNRGLPWSQKLIGFALIVGLGYVAKTQLHHSFNAFMLIRIGFPVAATVTLLWLWKAGRLTLGWAVAVAAIWGSFDLFRNDGFDGQLRSALAWRWTPSAEEKFLAQSRVSKPKTSALGAAVAFEPTANEWAEFRGPMRDGVLHGTTIATNWDVAPPRLVWKKAVGPAWSSMIVIGQRLFTQEQRGPQEAVVCYDARNGDEVWAHTDETRFDDSLSGIGPRATPTLVKGRLYTLGATGFLNCLEAENGKTVWKRDIRVDSHAPTMQWGFSSSPLVYDGKVFVYAGNDGDKGMLAYRADTGEFVWGSGAGKTSYSSAQLLTVDGVKQVAMLHDGGVTGFDPVTGKKLWQAGDVFPGSPRCCQPRLVSSNDLVVGPLIGLGTSSLKITRQGEQWNVATNWVTKEMKPEFPDYVISKGYAFGFDAGIFCCIRLADGKRVWKDGRYGRGQVVLLAGQDLLLVASETGDLVLLAADPTAHKELGKIKAIEGKTWACPVAHGDLIFHRNAQEMACFSTSAAPGQKPIASGL